jgi:hypothetical protein
LRTWVRRLPNHHQPIRIPVWERPEDHCIDQPENSAINSDTDGQSKYYR